MSEAGGDRTDEHAARVESPLRRALTRLGVSVGILSAVVAPLVVTNFVIEPSTGDRPVRLSPWFESFETFAMLLMVGTIPLAIIHARRARRGMASIVVTALVQSCLVFFVAMPAMYISRGGAVLGDDFHSSHAGPHGQRAVVYSQGFMDGCRFGVYLAKGWSLSMQRVRKTRSCTAPTIAWDEETGELLVKDR